ncbi:MAG: helix-turn-helix transcriptional regulator [Lachnospiraceae bacterium]|nr:helix-turn-helix transcriptional regulator [Lachnospiraceae bacterium]
MSENKFNSIFSNNLRYYLNRNTMSQVELAKRLNVGTTSVYNWCNGIKTPRMDKVDAMCAIFSCKRSDLITEWEPAAPSDSVAPVQLRPDEGRLLKYYNKLNDFGQSKAMDYLSDLADNVKYLKGEDVSEGLSDVG